MLYGNRDVNEASLFVDTLVDKLFINTKDVSVLDLCCGNGRHSYHLASKYPFIVYGCDLSSQNIEDANQKKLDNLSYFVHDMRQTLPLTELDWVLNLFTSIGYFTDRNENFQVLNSIHQSIKPDGKLVIDFFNAHWVKDNLHPTFTKEINGITFNISKEIINDFIIKKIEVVDGDKTFHFEEIVDLITLSVFNQYLTQSGFNVLKVFGDYELSDFDPEQSPRLIILAQKI